MQSRNPAKRIAVSVAVLCAALGGCTAVRVKPVSADTRIDHICIEKNPKVMVGDFVAVMQEGFRKHGITSQVFSGETPANCLYTSTYIAFRGWDLAPYMIDAEIEIYRDGRPIASGNYHLRGGGGFSLAKWGDTRWKILPVIDQLLAQVAPSDREIVSRNDAPAGALTAAVARNGTPVELNRKLAELKEAFDARLISEQEYDAKRKALIDQL